MFEKKKHETDMYMHDMRVSQGRGGRRRRRRKAAAAAAAAAAAREGKAAVEKEGLEVPRWRRRFPRKAIPSLQVCHGQWKLEKKKKEKRVASKNPWRGWHRSDP